MKKEPKYPSNTGKLRAEVARLGWCRPTSICHALFDFSAEIVRKANNTD